VRRSEASCTLLPPSLLATIACLLGSTKMPMIVFSSCRKPIQRENVKHEPTPNILQTSKMNSDAFNAVSEATNGGVQK